MEHVRKVLLSEHGDERGHLVAIESGIDVPFEIKRIFYIYGSDPSVVRGQHANRLSEFVLINIQGSCKVKIIDRKGEEEVVLLDKPHVGIYLPPMYWKDMYEFSSDSLLMVLASEHYDSSEYIRDFNTFREEIKNDKK